MAPNWRWPATSSSPEESAKFGLPEVKRGLIAAAGGVFRIVDQLPRKVAMQLLFTGEPISAAEALRWGLINEVVPDGTEVDAALALAERITVNAPLAVQASKRVAVGIDKAGGEVIITGDEAGLDSHHARDRRTDEVRGRQGGPAGLRREAPAGVEGPLILADRHQVGSTMPPRDEAEEERDERN